MPWRLAGKTPRRGLLPSHEQPCHTGTRQVSWVENPEHEFFAARVGQRCATCSMQCAPLDVYSMTCEPSPE